MNLNKGITVIGVPFVIIVNNMNLILQKFQKAKEVFNKEHEKDQLSLIMQKIITLVNELGQHFNTLNGGELAEIQMKLAGYKFFIADEIAELQRISESFKMEMKEIKAKRWDEITEIIKAEKGKVSNKEQIENVLILETKNIAHQQILYETKYYQYKMKMSALDDILTAVVQQIASKKREVEMAKSI